MILKGSQRGGAGQLATHLLKTAENEHVELHEVRGFVATDLHGALHEAYAVSRGTKCRQFMFSVSLNPPPSEAVPVAAFEQAVERIEEKNGLSGHPRVVVFHEKEGRRHAHAVWSRIDGETMTAKNLAFFKNRLREVSKELYLEHGWQMPRGLMDSEARDPCNFSLEEWQQAKRTGRDAGELKQTIQECWAVSDGRAAFASALEERGLYLARGDRRGYVALDHDGEAFSVSRFAGKTAKEVKAWLGDPADWRGVDETRAHVADTVMPVLERHIAQAKTDYARRMTPLHAERLSMRDRHRTDRDKLAESQRQRRETEEAERAARLRRGIVGLWDRLTGRRARTIRENEEATRLAAERDRDRRDALVASQLADRRRLQERIVGERDRHRETVQGIHADLERYRTMRAEAATMRTAATMERGKGVTAEFAERAGPASPEERLSHLREDRPARTRRQRSRGNDTGR